MTALYLRSARPRSLRPQWNRRLTPAIQSLVSAVQSRGYASTFPDLPVLRAISSHDPTSTSIVHSVSGRSFTYGNLFSDILAAQKRLEGVAARSPKAQELQGKPVAFLAENSYDYVGTALFIRRGYLYVLA